MKNIYSPEQCEFLDELQQQYRAVADGVCMARFGYSAAGSTDDCKGPIGRRHAIAKRHLQLIADTKSQIRANKEGDSFADWADQYNDLQLVPISRFAAGKWSCQRHDERFAGIDAQRVDLSKPENLFKAVYRVVLRQSHLMLARWNAVYKGIQSEAGWERFKETAFYEPVNDSVADNAVNDWKNEVLAIVGKARDLERRLTGEEWDSLDCRAIFLKSKPVVAGWRCLKMKSSRGGLRVNDPRRHWSRFIDLAYMIVIPQDGGHAIITACEPEQKFRVQEIVKIHNYIPKCENPNEPYQPAMHLKQRISRRIWMFDEIGMTESLYQSWSEEQQKEVQAWMKVRSIHQPKDLGSPSNQLPNFFCEDGRFGQ